VKVKLIQPKPNAPAKLLANVELIGFIPNAPNIKMVDLAIWEGNDDKGPWVAFPGRQYTDGAGKKKTARFIRTVGEEWDDMNKLTAFILAEYRKWDETRPEPGDDEADEAENPFA
jgi:hypothetical protein